MAKAIDLRPQVLDLKLYSGDGVNITLTVVDKDDEPIDLNVTTEDQIKAQIKAKREDSSPVTGGTFDVDITNADNGIVVLTLTGANTTSISNGKKFTGFWDIQWTPTGSQPRTLCQGKVECDVDVSR